MTDTQSSAQVQQETSSPGFERVRRMLGGGEINVGQRERYGSLLGGAGLLLAGILRRGIGGAILGAFGAALLQRGATGHCAVYNQLGMSSAESDRPGVPGNAGIKVERSVTIARPPEELFAFWRNFSNLARFMNHIKRVDVIDEKRSHWVATGPGGKELHWDAVVINEHPNSMIAWESLPGADVQNAGSVRFNPAPGGRGTEVRVLMEYNPPGGVVGALVARLFGESPEQEMDEDLGRLKQTLEAGEIATVTGQPSGRA